MKEKKKAAALPPAFPVNALSIADAEHLAD